MTQRFLHLMAPEDQLATLWKRLEESGFRVHRSNRMSGGIHVRVREGDPDEAEVARIAGEVAPGLKYGPAGAPVSDVAGYREGD